MTAGSTLTLRIGQVRREERDDVFGFHQSFIGEFLLPLTPEAFAELVEAGTLLAVHRDDRIVGVCYVKPDGKNLDDVLRWEIGGIHLDPAVRGYGLGEALTAVRITQAIGIAPRPVMAYVHRENREPRGYLRRLGFADTGRTVRLGPTDAAGYLRRDAAGDAVADVLTLAPPALSRLATWLEDFDGTIAGRNGRAAIALPGTPLWTSRTGLAATLRQAAEQRTF
ncbi:GNAT family N-acetyltransferase [Catenuloplanes sp. NPDC051500]|uniref:GNAT family N-acetyltransferase n=1 Tax=Catenuloplanes sp. NPDC051500 TaxID=3363959 RepID=UPI0037B711DA